MNTAEAAKSLQVLWGEQRQQLGRQNTLSDTDIRVTCSHNYDGEVCVCVCVCVDVFR